jgi:hypothetical protein
MAGITSRKELEEFLKTRPREDSIAIAARLSLRILPFLFTPDARSRTFRGRILPCMRANSISWFAAGMTGHQIEVAIYAARAAYLSTTTIASKSSAFAAHTAYATSAVTPALDAATIAATAADIWPSINADIEALRNKQNLAEAQLWPDGIPPEIEENWQNLKAILLSFPEENWQVWTDWYEARLKGGPFNAGLEKARALLPDEFWKKGHTEVNAEIARLIKEHTQLEPSIAKRSEPPVDRSPVLPPDRAAPLNFELREVVVYRVPVPALAPDNIPLATISRI